MLVAMLQTVGVWSHTGVLCREQQMKPKQTSAKADLDPEDTVVESTSSGAILEIAEQLCLFPHEVFPA